MTRYRPLDPELSNRLIDDAGLGAIREKVDAGERLSFDDGVTLYETPHLAAVGAAVVPASRRASPSAPSA